MSVNFAHTRSDHQAELEKVKGELEEAEWERKRADAYTSQHVEEARQYRDRAQAAEARHQSLRAGVQELATWAEQEALKAARDQEDAKSIYEADWYAGALATLNRTESKAKALLDSEPQKQGEVATYTHSQDADGVTPLDRLRRQAAVLRRSTNRLDRENGQRILAGLPADQNPDQGGNDAREADHSAGLPVVDGAAVEGGGGPENLSDFRCSVCDREAVFEKEIGSICAFVRPGRVQTCQGVLIRRDAPQHQPSDTTELAPDQGGRKESAGELRSGVEGEALWPDGSSEALTIYFGPDMAHLHSESVAVPVLPAASVRKLAERLEGLAVGAEATRDESGRSGAVDSESYWQGKGHAFTKAAQLVRDQLLRDSGVGK